MSDLRVGGGTSTCADTERAVAEAVDAARAALGGVEPALSMVSVTVEHEAQRVYAALRRALPHTRIHGTTSSLGVLAEQGVVMGPGGGLGVLLFGSERHASFAAAGASTTEGVRRAARASAERVAKEAKGGAKPHLLFLAATPGNEEEVLAGIADVFPGVPICGGSAADHAIEGAWSVVCDDGAHRQGVSLAAVYGDVRVGMAFDGPYEVTDKSEQITESAGRTIMQLGGRPATSVLCDWVDGGGTIAQQVEEGGNILMQTALSPFAIAKHTPQGTTFFRLLHPAFAKVGGALDVFAEAPKGERICLMRGNEEALIQIVDRLADQALAQARLQVEEVRGAYLVYCAGCAGVVGGRLNEVLDRLRTRLHGVPLLGSCSFGEQGFVPGIGNVHANLSVGVAVFG